MIGASNPVTPPSDPRHLLTVWNPAYASDALDEHLRVLLHWAHEHRAGRADEDDVYVWWGKVRSTRREQALPHADQVLAIDEQIQRGVETHLYLTDYRSLYVGWILEITADDVLREMEGEAEHMPSYYEGHRVDFWFRLQDLRRIVADDTPAVIQELGRLRNVNYHDRPVSLYGGMVDLPLVVTSTDGTSWFGGSSALLDEQLWAERDAELRGETGRIAHELRDNLFGQAVWTALDPTTRTFLASGDAVFRARRDDPAFDFATAAVEYAKAVETELNAQLLPALRPVMRGKPTPEREVTLSNRRIDLGDDVPHLGLGELLHLFEHAEHFRKAIRTAFPHDWKWLEGELPSHLETVAALRNPAAHSEALSREDMVRHRETILGIGCEGLITMLARIGLRSS